MESHASVVARIRAALTPEELRQINIDRILRYDESEVSYHQSGSTEIVDKIRRILVAVFKRS